MGMTVSFTFPPALTSGKNTWLLLSCRLGEARVVMDAFERKMLFCSYRISNQDPYITVALCSVHVLNEVSCLCVKRGTV
jgi:hypothetical protein